MAVKRQKLRPHVIQELQDEVQVLVVDENIEVYLNAVTVTGGNAENGAGIQNAGTLHIDNSTISANNAKTDGGGIYNDGGTIIIANSSFSANSAGAGGGAKMGRQHL